VSALTTAFPIRRAAFAALTVALAVALVLAIGQHGHLGLAIAFLVLPDLALLFGGGRGLERGQLHPRAVPVYNLVHRLWGPAALGAAVATGLLGGFWIVAALAWGVHVALDRSVGYGLRTRDGFQRAG
jgi:hypothetical protein